MNRFLTLAFCSLALYGAGPSSMIEREVLTAMADWKQAMLQRDRAGLEKLYAPDLTYSHSTGRVETKAEAIEASVNGKTQVKSIQLANMTVRGYGNTALVKGNVTLQTSVDGKMETIPLSVLHVWVKNASGWQMVARQATRLAP